MSRVEQKTALLGAMKLKLEMLTPMLKFADLELEMPSSTTDMQVLKAAEKWLDGYLKISTVFMAAYTQPHTGDVFWQNLKVTGIPKGSVFDDLAASKEMRGILHRVHQKFKSRPEVMGGAAKVKKEARKGDTEEDSPEANA